MKKYLIVSLCMAASCSFGATVSFNPTGTDSAVVAADMTAATTGDVGGTWVMNGTAVIGGGAEAQGSQYAAYSDTPSDYVMVWDYLIVDGSSLDLSLPSAQSFDAAPLEISWDLAGTRAITRDKIVSIVGYGADGSTEAFRFDWKLTEQQLYANGAGGAQVMGAFNPSILDGIKTLDINSANMATMGITLDGTSLTYLAEGLTDVTTTVLNSQTALSKISFEVEVAANGVGLALDNVNVTTELPASIVSFSASPEDFVAGETVTLDWEVLDADSVSIDNGIGSVAAAGSMELSPTNSTTWTLSAVRGAVTTTAQTTATLTTSDAVIVYEDHFDNDGLDANTGTGGGLSVTASANAATWADSGTLDFSSDNGDNNERATVSSINSFSLSGGFELTVTYSVSDITTDTDGNRFSFGLVSHTPDFSTDPFGLSNGTRPAGFTSFGLNVTVEDSLQGLTLNTGSASLVAGQSGFTSSTTEVNTVTLSVDAAGDYTLVLNGSSVGSGASGLDLSDEFYFAAFSQDNLANPSISSVSLSAVVAGNLAPSATAQSVATAPDTPVEITLTGFDYEGSNLTYSVETFPTNGTLAGATNVWTYIPTNGYLGADSFTFTVHDGETNSAPAMVSITVSEDELYEGGEYADAYTNPTNNPALPNVLLIGDSISIGYTVQVRKSLAGKADVYRIPKNGRYTAYGLDNLNSWLTNTGPGEWDVIHFNWGLWDLCYRNPESSNQGGRDKVDGTLTTTLEDYRANMEQLVARMKETDASLMWCATTPVPEGELGRFEGDDLIYNGIAEEVMATNAVPTNDLHSYALLALPEIQKDYGDVHFTADGYVYLGKKVAQEIEGVLQERFVGDFGVGDPSDGPGMVLKWQARSGASYGVMATTNLVDGPWIEMTNGIAGEDDLISVTNTVSEGQQFFRVTVEME